ncbi:uncharacterized protein LOC121866066 [Homarus americanus]|uniref:uncharacterized protein LOC121866066 n=1 Tax=Homarus americanus TaxID=6706 RepID=UPI001C44F1B4|nr:uncharacterized protein LOC121866066 [Homarus americanus]
MAASYLLVSSTVLAALVCVVTSHKQAHTPISMRCVSQGRFPHPEDCGGFVDCLPDGAGGLKAREGTCRGRAYHPTLRKCVSLQKVHTCKPRSARALVSDPKLDFVCEGASSEFVCADCKTLVNCVNGTAYPEPCGSGDLCAFKEPEFGGGVCYPGQPLECTCDQPNQFKVDNYDDARFFFCSNEGSDPQIYQCPDDQVFDTTMSQCTNYAGLPECTNVGVFANVNNCTQYYTCIFTINGWVQKPFSCDNATQEGFMYNEASGKCEDPCSWETGRFTCSKEGRFPDPLNCNRYYECVADSTHTSGLRQDLHECPEGYEWDPSARSEYGHCVLEGTSKSKCSPVRYNKCTISQDQCNQSPAEIPALAEVQTLAETQNQVPTEETQNQELAEQTTDVPEQ